MELISFAKTLADDFHRSASSLVEGVFEKISGPGENLRDGTEFTSVDLPRDLFAHDRAQTEWWYYTGHGKTGSGRHFGFELVFFKRRTDLDKFSVVPLRLIGNPFYFAHFAITDHQNRSFRYAHKKSANGPFDEPAFATASHYHLQQGGWSATMMHGMHYIKASLDDGTNFEVGLKPQKPAILNGENGVSFKDEGEASRYFAYTRMAAEGTITIDGRSEHFTGSAWMDREFGTWAPTENQKGWDWFSIQLNNDTELMCYQLRNAAGAPTQYSSGSFIDKDGNVTRLTAGDFQLKSLGSWKSSKSSAEYPSGWSVKVEELGIELNISPVMLDQELDTRGTTMIIYWEGACRVSGTVRREAVSGNAYVELVGYDRSHDSPNLAYFLLGNPSELISKIGIK